MAIDICLTESENEVGAERDGTSHASGNPDGHLVLR